MAVESSMRLQTLARPNLANKICFRSFSTESVKSRHSDPVQVLLFLLAAMAFGCSIAAAI